MKRKNNSQKIILQQLSQDLEDLENFLKDLWQFLPLPICYVNPNQIILDVNLALESFFGFDSMELIGEKVEMFFVKRDLAQKILQEILEKKTVLNKEGKVLTKHGKKKITNISASSRQDSEGNIIGYYLAFSEITELKKLQKELEEKVKERTEELQEKIEELEKFQKLAVGRELKMVELKEEIEMLKERLTPS